MCIGTSEGASGSAARQRAVPLHGSVGLGAASHTCGTLCAIVPACLGGKVSFAAEGEMEGVSKQTDQFKTYAKKDNDGKVVYAILFRFQ
jgi:hypothetical protein